MAEHAHQSDNTPKAPVQEYRHRTILRIEWHLSRDIDTPFRCALGTPPCPVGHSVCAGGIDILRIAPTALWAVSDTSDVSGMEEALETFRRSTKAASVDVSHGLTAFALTSPDGVDCLQAGSPADLDAALSFEGAVCHTVFERHNLTIHRRDEALLDLYVDRSFAVSLLDRLIRRLNSPS